MVLQRHKKADSPPIPLYPYQSAWVEDESRFKLWVKSRDIGASFADTLAHVERRIEFPGLTVWLSASERQSKEAIQVVKTHAEVAEKKFEYDEIEFPGTLDKALLVTLKHNGARIMAMPSNPATIRGFKGDVVLDEFGFHREPVPIWRAVLGIMSRGFTLDVISTPNGQSGKFHDLAKACGVDLLGGTRKTHWKSGQWSVHWCDIYTAVQQGCPIDPKAMREAADDEDTWLQEYCCTFLADAENYIPMELIVACENEGATLELPLNFQPQGPLYLGGDIGRKKDRTVFWLWEKVGDVLWTRLVKVLHRKPFHVQAAYLDAILPMVTRAALDATGIGAMLAEEAQRKHGPKVEAVDFNMANKESMATLTKRTFEDRKARIPAAAFIRRSFNAVKRYTSVTGRFRFDAARTDQGHADEFWAGALGLAAASGPALSTDLVASGRGMAAQLGPDFGGGSSAYLASQGF